jgi:hypothetical protein
MALAAAVMAVRPAGGIEVPLGAAGIRRAAVARLMHVKAVLARRQAGDAGLDADLLAGGLERDGAADLAAGTGFERRVGARAARVHRGAGAEQGGQGGEADEMQFAVNARTDLHWGSPCRDGVACARPILVASFFWVFCAASASSLYPNSCRRRTRQAARLPGGSGKGFAGCGGRVSADFRTQAFAGNRGEFLRHFYEACRTLAPSQSGPGHFS